MTTYIIELYNQSNYTKNYVVFNQMPQVRRAPACRTTMRSASTCSDAGRPTTALAKIRS
jgi:hypothetical protein